MRILLLGGTGAIGSELTKLLVNDTYDEIGITSRNRTGTSGLIHYYTGDAHDPLFINSILETGWDIIVDFMVYSTPQFIERYQKLLNNCNHYVFISTSRVYANAEGSITETSPRLLDVSTDKDYLATDEYALTKARQEDVLINSKLSNWTIIRPYITYGPNRLQLGVFEKEAWLYRAMKGRTIVFSSDIATKLTTLTSGVDVARGLHAIIGLKDVQSEAFHIATEEAVTWEQVLSIYLDELHNVYGKVKCELVSLNELRRIHASKYQVLYDRQYDRVFNSIKIKRYMKDHEFIPLELGLRNSVKEQLLFPRFGQIDWRLEARKDIITGERAAFNELKSAKVMAKYLASRYLNNLGI